MIPYIPSLWGGCLFANARTWHGPTDNEGSHCEGCGRSHAEIAETKKLVMQVVDFAQQQEYENIEEFANYFAKKVLKKLK